jgi:hypothetical protein
VYWPSGQSPDHQQASTHQEVGPVSLRQSALTGPAEPPRSAIGRAAAVDSSPGLTRSEVDSSGLIGPVWTSTQQAEGGLLIGLKRNYPAFAPVYARTAIFASQLPRRRLGHDAVRKGINGSDRNRIRLRFLAPIWRLSSTRRMRPLTTPKMPPKRTSSQTFPFSLFRPHKRNSPHSIPHGSFCLFS